MGRRVLGVVASLMLAGTGVAATAPGVHAQISSSTTFTANDSYQVPAGVCQVTIAAYGGHGGKGAGGATTNDGGAGGRIEADFPVAGTLDVFVGLQGANATGLLGGGGIGGVGFNHGGNGGYLGGGGGGSSAVQDGTEVLIVAGGGGGGSTNPSGGAGGVGGVASGNGSDGTGLFHGAGGLAGPPNTSANDGGNAPKSGGGGGAGSAPGTGATSDQSEDGGGGGASAVSTTALGSAGAPVSSLDFDGKVTITPADPGIGCAPTLQVKKAVSGTSTGPFTEQVNCTAPTHDTVQSTTTVDNVDLLFHADGTPDSTTTPSGWVVSNGTWQLHDDVLTGSTCTVTETVTGGATSVSYACAWTPGAADHLSGVGCPGTSSGPSAMSATVTFEGNGDSGLATVTNTFTPVPTMTTNAPTTTTPAPAAPTPAAAAVAATPSFTG